MSPARTGGRLDRHGGGPGESTDLATMNSVARSDTRERNASDTVTCPCSTAPTDALPAAVARRPAPAPARPRPFEIPLQIGGDDPGIGRVGFEHGREPSPRCARRRPNVQLPHRRLPVATVPWDVGGRARVRARYSFSGSPASLLPRRPLRRIGIVSPAVCIQLVTGGEFG